MRAVAAVATGSILEGEAAGGSRTRHLGAGAGTVGGESADRSGQRVSGAPAVVRSKRDGRIVGTGFSSSGKRPAVPVPGSSVATQARAVRASPTTLERSVRGGVRSAAVRSDQHVRGRGSRAESQ